MIALTTVQKALFAHIDQLISDNGHLAYDFRDAKQYDFARMMIELTGDVDKYPGMLQSLALAKASHEKNGPPKAMLEDTTGWQNMFTIPGLNLTKNGTLAANGMATIVGGYSSMNLSLMVISRSSGKFVANGFANNFTQTMLTVSTLPSTSTEIDVDAYMHYHGTSNGMSENSALAPPPFSGVVKRVKNNAVNGDPIVSAPIRTTTKPNNPKAVNIGLGRAWTDQGGNSQFDYAWNEPVPPPGQSPQGKIPFVGSVVFSAAIMSPLILNESLVLNVYVTDQTGGGGTQLLPSDYALIAAAFSIDTANPAKLNWSLPAGVSTSDPGNPIVFGRVPWLSDIQAYFFCEIDVALTGGVPASAYIQSSDSPDPDPMDGTAYIMPIDFIWHCLAEDSLVAMADGSNKIIKDIVAGEQVRINNQGDSDPVEWTNLGAHKGPVILVETDTGAKITASHHHVFFTETSTKSAMELKPGDRLKMLQGMATVKMVSHVTYEGLLCNLATIEYQDPKDDKAEIGVFYANDFMVGDINAQKVLKHRRCNDINWVKSQVPEYLHVDVDVFFKEKKSARGGL